MPSRAAGLPAGAKAEGTMRNLGLELGRENAGKTGDTTENRMKVERRAMVASRVHLEIAVHHCSDPSEREPA